MPSILRSPAGAALRVLAVVVLGSAGIAAAEDTRFEVELERSIQHGNQVYEKALNVRVTKGGNPQPDVRVLARMANPDGLVQLAGKDGKPTDVAEASTNAEGVAVFDIATGALSPSTSQRRVEFVVITRTDGGEAKTKLEVELKALTVSTVFGVSSFQPGRTYPEGLTVIVEEAGAAKADAEVSVRALDTPVRIRLPDQDAEDEPKAKTDKEGKATFVIDTRDVPPPNAGPSFALEVTVQVGESRVRTTKTPLLGQGYESSFLSDRVSSEVFLGASFARSYDEQGRSSGFDETSFVGRLRIDTLWTQRSKAALHTGIEIQFGSFPTTTGQTAENPVSITSYADSFTGSLSVVYMPPWRWATHFSETSRSPRPERRFDALRVGLIARGGLMSRDVKDSTDGDTDLGFFRAGLLMTHHQTHASSPREDNVNVFPMRYVEISWGRYEQIFDQHNADRLVVEAGLRLPGVGNDAIPFYAGIYLNAGEGQDDLRIFAGMLFHINKLVEIFQK